MKITNQAEWDKLPAKFDTWTDIEIRVDGFIRINSTPDNSQVTAYDNNAAMNRPDPERAAFERWYIILGNLPNRLGPLDDKTKDAFFRAFMAGTAHGLEIALKRIQEDM